MKALKLLLAISLVTNVVLCGILWRDAKRPLLTEISSISDEKPSQIDVSFFVNPVTSNDLLTYFGQPIKLDDGFLFHTETSEQRSKFSIPHFHTSPKPRRLQLEDGPLKLPFSQPPSSELGLFVSPEGV